MINYRTELGYQPPLTPDIQRQRMQEMSRYAPVGGEDTFASSLNLPAYQRQAEMANLDYNIKNNSARMGQALAGLGEMANQRAQQDAMIGSLLGGLMRQV